MSYTNGIIPKYLVTYSIIKIIFVLQTLLGNTRFNIPMSIFKIILNLTRIIGLKYIYSELWLKLTILSVLIEPFLFFTKNSIFNKIRFILEIILSAFSLFCIIFLHPFYRLREKKRMQFYLINILNTIVLFSKINSYILFRGALILLIDI